MARIELASLGAGVAQNPAGAVVPAAAGTIVVHNTATPVTIYATETAPTGNTAGTFITNSFGQIPGWIDPSTISGAVIDITILPAAPVTVLLSDVAGTAASLTSAEATRAGAAEALLIPLSQKGAANGVASLDGTAKLPSGQLPASVVNVSSPARGQVPVYSGTAWAAQTKAALDARDYGVIADGAQHNNVANLLDCLAQATALGIEHVVLPAGTIDTSEAVANATVTADSGRTYTNNGGLPLPVNQPMTIEGHGKGVTTLRLSAGFPRAFDFWWAADGQAYSRLRLRGLTIDRNNLTGATIAPLTAVTGGATLTHGSVWTTLPGISATTFANARLAYFPATNAGTAQGIAMACRISGGLVQVRNDSSSTDWTLLTGDQVQGALRDHVIAGTYQFGGTVPQGYNMTIDQFEVEDVETVNVATMTAASLTTAKADSSPNAYVYVQQNPGNRVMTPTITNCYARRVRMNGGEIGFQVAGNTNSFLDEVWVEDHCAHDTLVTPTSNYVSVNVMIGGKAWVGRCGIRHCHGRNSGDVAYEIDQPWEAHVEDCVWEESYSGAYRTTFVPPARTSAGPPTTTLSGNGGAITGGASSANIAALPANVARAGLILIDTELMWYTANTAGTALALFRSVNGTSAASHNDGATVTFVETFKTRIYETRSTIRTNAVLSTSAGGRGFLAFENNSLPLPPITIRDPTIEADGGALLAGQHVYWQGWQPDFDMEGLRLSQDNLVYLVSDASNGSAISWSWSNGNTLHTNSVPIPLPRIRGRNNRARVHGRLTTGVSYNALRAGAGWALFDFELDADVVMAGASAGSGVTVALMNPASSKMSYAPSSRLAIKGRMPSGMSSDAAPCLVQFGSTGFAAIDSVFDVDLDAWEQTYSANAADSNYNPWKIDTTQLGKVRFNRVQHSSLAAAKYGTHRRVVVRVTSGPYTCTGFEDEIQVDTNLGAVTINLPGSNGGSASANEYLGRGRELVIVDSGFAAATNNITITPVATDKMDNGTAGTSVTISANGGHKRYTAAPTIPGWITTG